MTGSATSSRTETTVPLRPPSTAMRLDRMGSAFQTRLSFMRSLIRRMSREGWRVERKKFDLDDQGYGRVAYSAVTPERCYSLVGFSHYLDPAQRTDRVIAEAWDATFTLFDGIPTEADIERLSHQTPRQEAGRYEATDLVMSRANKSVRLFGYVVGELAEGRQPDPKILDETGYLMRTTAVYGNGKFGLGDRSRYDARPEVTGPFRAELLAVYLIRCFTQDLVDHLAHCRNPGSAVPLDPRFKRQLGIGNATGLGMAPFLISHPLLIHNWFHARETALARVRALESATPEVQARFRQLLARAIDHVGEWQVEDACQTARITRLREDLALLADWAADQDCLAGLQPWDRLFRRAEDAFSLEGQEQLVSLLIEPYPDLVDDLAEGMEVRDAARLDPGMTVAALQQLVEGHYAWVAAIDYGDPAESHHFWYSSEEKLEPRRGERRSEPGADKEMPLTIARDVQALAASLAQAAPEETMSVFLMRYPEHRHIVRRVQSSAAYSYAEIQDNLIGAGCRPIDILRSKLAYFGASRFDPKSDLWTRITMYQGAPLADELSRDDADDWCFPTLPAAEPCTSP